MNTIRFIYFDVGGVLIDWSKAYETAASKFHVKAKEIFRVFDENEEQITKGFLSPQQLWEKYIQKYGIENAHTYNFVESWVSDYRPIHQMHEIINTFKSTYKIGLLSNIYKGMLPLLLEKKLIPDIHYEQIIFSCDVGMRKPDADIYAYAQRKADADPGTILLVDDRKDYADGARKAGWNTFLFDTNDRLGSVKKLELWMKTTRK
jgi:putative hydrolase of the HAD superfamily